MTDERTDSPSPTHTVSPAEQAMADTAPERPARGGRRTADAPPKPVRHVDPIALATTLRTHLGKMDTKRRGEVIARTEATVLDADTLRLVLAVNELPGVTDAADLRAALALALHGL